MWRLKLADRVIALVVRVRMRILTRTRIRVKLLWRLVVLVVVNWRRRVVLLARVSLVKGRLKLLVRIR